MSKAVPQPGVNMGQPVARIDGLLKVSGAARYGSDFDVPNPAFAHLVTSAIARGTIEAIGLADARAVDGVIEIFTHENLRGAIKAMTFFGQGGYFCTTLMPLQSNRIAHDGQIVALVLAESFEAACEAAHKVVVDYRTETAAGTFDAPGVEIIAATDAKPGHEDPTVGDAAAALAAADVAIDAEYQTPTQHHNAMELFTTTCVWNGRQLTIYEPSQIVYGLKYGIAEALGLDPDDVRVVSPFIGGAFGSKAEITPRTPLVALAARILGRPVKLVATRDQGFTIATYRAETRHRVKLGAGRDGKLGALSHEGFELTSRPDDYMVGGTDTTARLYAAPNVFTKVSLVRADRNTPGFMRSPPEVPYMFALESAMDELAVALKMDPIELRRVNDTMHEPIHGLPYSSRSLMPCFDAAAAVFGWTGRRPEPGAMRDGDWLIGYGCAATCYPSQMAPAAARVRLDSTGAVHVETAAHDVGTGAYTVIAQTAGKRLGVPLDKVTVAIGDSAFPPGPVAGGSITTASVCNVVAMACDKIRARLTNAPNAEAAGADLSDNDLRAAFARVNAGAIEEYAEYIPRGSKAGAAQKLYQGHTMIVGGPKDKDSVKFAFGAEFVEVRIHRLTREIRVPRVVGAFAAGHIVNPRTAHSQLMGGLIWGIGSALHEATEIDSSARYVNDNLADYLVPVNADVDDVEVIFVPEQDDAVNPLGIKGLGELGNVGTAAAIANAVFHATGRRIRKLPIRIESLLA